MQTTESSFLKDVADHRLVVLKDDGVYRHLRFKAPGTMMEHFDVLTWPGYLCYTGDMGTYVFTRTEDMLKFFRQGDRAERTSELRIKPSYWSEKVDGEDRFGGIMEFSEERFKRAVLGDLVAFLRDYRDLTTKEERRELWEAVVDEVLEADGDSGGFRKQCAAHDFRHRVNEEVGEFTFVDFGEHHVEDFTPRFLWCCYALVWGIERYDAYRATLPAAPSPQEVAEVQN